MQLDGWTLALQAVNAIVLLWLLSRFLFRPVVAIIAERQAAASAIIAQAEQARSAAEADRQAAHAEQDELQKRRGELLRAATDEAARQKEQLMAAARAELDDLRAAANTRIAAARAEEVRALNARAAELAVRIAGRLLSRLPESCRVSAFLPGLGEAIAKLPEPVRAKLGAAPARVIAPRALTGEEQQQVSDAVAAALGQPPVLRFEADPAVIAGIELEGPQAAARNSFRADLASIAQELARDG